jgi:hypothetical protein
MYPPSSCEDVNISSSVLVFNYIYNFIPPSDKKKLLILTFFILISLTCFIFNEALHILSKISEALLIN